MLRLRCRGRPSGHADRDAAAARRRGLGDLRGGGREVVHLTFGTRELDGHGRELRGAGLEVDVAGVVRGHRRAGGRELTPKRHDLLLEEIIRPSEVQHLGEMLRLVAGESAQVQPVGRARVRGVAIVDDIPALTGGPGRVHDLTSDRLVVRLVPRLAQPELDAQAEVRRDIPGTHDDTLGPLVGVAHDDGGDVGADRRVELHRVLVLPLGLRHHDAVKHLGPIVQEKQRSRGPVEGHPTARPLATLAGLLDLFLGLRRRGRLFHGLGGGHRGDRGGLVDLRLRHRGELLLGLGGGFGDLDGLGELVGAAVLVLVLVEGLGLVRAEVGEVRDAVLIVVEVGAAVVVLPAVRVFDVDRALVLGVGDAVRVVVRVRAAVGVLVEIDVLGLVGAAVGAVHQAVTVRVDRGGVRGLRPLFDFLFRLRRGRRLFGRGLGGGRRGDRVVLFDLRLVVVARQLAQAGDAGQLIRILIGEERRQLEVGVVDVGEVRTVVALFVLLSGHLVLVGIESRETGHHEGFVLVLTLFELGQRRRRGVVAEREVVPRRVLGERGRTTAHEGVVRVHLQERRRRVHEHLGGTAVLSEESVGHHADTRFRRLRLVGDHQRRSVARRGCGRLRVDHGPIVVLEPQRAFRGHLRVQDARAAVGVAVLQDGVDDVLPAPVDLDLSVHLQPLVVLGEGGHHLAVVHLDDRVAQHHLGRAGLGVVGDEDLADRRRHLVGEVQRPRSGVVLRPHPVAEIQAQDLGRRVVVELAPVPHLGVGRGGEEGEEDDEKAGPGEDGHGEVLPSEACRQGLG